MKKLRRKKKDTTNPSKSKALFFPAIQQKLLSGSTMSGNDIYYNKENKPSSKKGHHLVGHELTHTYTNK